MRSCLRVLQQRASPSPYVVLGVSPNASMDEIRKRYRELAHQYHPDVAATGNANKFREVTAAYYLIKADKTGGRKASSEHTSRSSSSTSAQHRSSVSDQEERLKRESQGEQKMYNRNQWFVHQELWNRDGYEYLTMGGCAFLLALWTTDHWLSQKRQLRVEDLSRLADSQQQSKAVFEPLSQPAPNGSVAPPPPSVAATPPPQASPRSHPAVATSSSTTTPSDSPSSSSLTRLRNDLLRSRRQRFSDVKEFLYEYDPDGVDVRRVSTQRFASDMLQEPSVLSQCVHHVSIHSDFPQRALVHQLDHTFDKLERTLWAYVDAPVAGILALSMLHAVPVLSPNSAKWTLVEYKPSSANSSSTRGAITECLVAIRNEKYSDETAGPVQRIIIGGHDELQAAALLLREKELASGLIRSKDLVHGGVVKLKDTKSFRGRFGS